MKLSRYLNGFDPVARRDFIAGAAKGLLGLSAVPWMTKFAAAQETGQIPLQPATARNVIYLYMAGGMSHLDTFDMKPGAATQGPIEAIKTNAAGVRVSQYFPQLARHMDKVAVINSMNSNQGAHAQGRYYMHTSYQLRGTIRHPSIGAWLENMRGRLNTKLPAHVVVGGGAQMASNGFFDASLTPLPVGDPSGGLANSHRVEHVTEERFEHRIHRLDKMNKAFRGKYDARELKNYAKVYQEAMRLMDSKDLEAFDIDKESEAVRAAYGDGRFGQGCLLARRLVERGVRFVEVVSGGWDTHSENFDQMGDLCPPIDRALSSLLADLDARGLLDETLVVLATEFGRTPDIVQDRNLGRNHYPKAFSCLLAGGGIKGGRTYGKTDPEGREVIADMVKVEDFNATLAYALGLPLEFKVYSPSGRPFKVAHDGKPVKALF
ncbi:MAG: DUF1501 domain-containing protein [Planctomycetota bacterium]|nr:DUF1501 domain-containing protein [Planctomycetota bacterium]